MFVPVILISGVFFDVKHVPGLPARHRAGAAARPPDRRGWRAGSSPTTASISNHLTSLAVIGIWGVLGITLAIRGFSWDARTGVTRRALGRATLARQLLLERSTLGAVAAIERTRRHAGPGAATAVRRPVVAAWRGSSRRSCATRCAAVRWCARRCSAARSTSSAQPTSAAFAWPASRRSTSRHACCAIARPAPISTPCARSRGPLSRSARGPRPQMRELMAARRSRARTLARSPTWRGCTCPLAMVPSEDELGIPARSGARARSRRDRRRDRARAPLPRRVRAGERRRRAGVVGGAAGWARRSRRCGDELVRLRDESGRELFDLPDAPRPPPDAPAPRATAPGVRQPRAGARRPRRGSSPPSTGRC